MLARSPEPLGAVIGAAVGLLVDEGVQCIHVGVEVVGLERKDVGVH